MNISGMFLDTKGVLHQFYENETNQYYRLDICERGASYHTEPDKVEYSIYKRKDTYIYGSTDIFEQYQALSQCSYNMAGETSQTSEWRDGKFFVEKHKENKGKSFKSKTVICNGTLVEFEVFLGEQWLMYVSSGVSVIKLEPLNIKQYTKSVISMSDTDHVTYTTPYYPYDVLTKRYDLQHILDMDLVVADTAELAEQRLKEWYESDCPYKGFDTETTGLDVWKFGDDRLVGIILSIGTESSTYFPFRMEHIPNLDKAFMDKLMGYCIEQQDRLVAHNKKFDRQVMMKEGYDLCIKWDTHTISFMLNPVTIKGSHALKELVMKLNGKKFLELDEIFISKSNIDFSVLPADITKIYACTDSTNAVELLLDLIPKVPQSMWPLIMIEMQLSDLKADQEYYGMRVDVAKYMYNYENCEYILDLLVKTFRKITHEDGNLGSPEVLATLLYDKMGCSVLMRTKTGLRSTSSKAIDKLASTKASTPHNITEPLRDKYGKVIIKAEKLANSKYPALVILSKYREYAKLKNSFYARFERTLKTGRISFWINQNGASSGRQSSPMHQLPPELKDVIISDSEDKDLWGPDYSQIELRMIGYLAGETELIDMCKVPTNDIHRVCASLITGKEMWEITAEERTIKKRVNFGVIYLISGYGLAGQLYGPGSDREQVEYCQGQLDAFYKRFKRIHYYLSYNAIKVAEQGYMKTALGRVKYFDQIFNPDITSRERASIIRQANNMPVQGTAADLMKLAEVNMYNYIRNKGWNKETPDGFPKVRVMLSIHDEALISADKKIALEEIITMITKCMEIELKGAPPFFVQPAKMSNWGGHSDDSLAIPILYRDKLIEDYERTGISVFKRSYYKLGMDPETKVEYNKFKGSVSEKVKRFGDKVTIEKLSGNYSDELTGESRDEAIRIYMESGFDVYTDDNYKVLLKAYADGVLHDYMEDLISKYGPDPYNVGQHVRHPSLTHDLLSRYHEELSQVDLTHSEQIDYATKLYMEHLGSSLPKSTKIEEESIVNDPDEFIRQTENLYTFDKDGGIIYEESDPEDNDADYITDFDAEDILLRVEGKVYRAWKLMDMLVLDVNRLSYSDVDKVIAKAWEYRDSNGFYKVSLAMNNSIIDAKFRVEDIDVDEMSDFIARLEGSASVL